MAQRTVKKLATLTAVFALVGFSQAVFSADELKGRELIEAQLEEAKKLLAEDKASHEETEAKKAAIDERLAAREARAEEIRQEMTQLCEEQDKLSPGTLDSCLAKLNN